MRRAIDPRVDLAARNNAEWCDAVTRGHGRHGRFEPEIWINPGDAPLFYPNAVTLMAGNVVPAAIADARGAFSVKDSFHALKLSPLGFTPLFDATWIWRDAVQVRADGSASWHVVRDAAALSRWEAAWRGDAPALDLFRPALLEECDHAFIAVEAEGAMVAGCVASRSAAVVGISNLFGPEDRADACLAGVQAFAPGRAVVGYEHGPALATMKGLGFQEIGPLRVWVRETG